MPIKTHRIPKNVPKLTELINRAKILSGMKTRQEIINRALQFFVEYLEKKDIKKEPSFYELTKHLAGRVEGPSDLAHNKKHLQGFGR